MWISTQQKSNGWLAGRLPQIYPQSIFLVPNPCVRWVGCWLDGSVILMDFAANETPHGSQLDENGSPVQTTYLGFLQSPQLFLSGYFLSSIDLIYSTLLFQVSRLSTFAKCLFPCLMGGNLCEKPNYVANAFDVEIPLLYYIQTIWPGFNRVVPTNPANGPMSPFLVLWSTWMTPIHKQVTRLPYPRSFCPITERVIHPKSAAPELPKTKKKTTLEVLIAYYIYTSYIGQITFRFLETMDTWIPKRTTIFSNEMLFFSCRS